MDFNWIPIPLFNPNSLLTASCYLNNHNKNSEKNTACFPSWGSFKGINPIISISCGDIIKTYITKVADQRVSIYYFYEILNYLNPEIQHY